MYSWIPAEDFFKHIADAKALLLDDLRIAEYHARQDPSNPRFVREFVHLDGR